MSKSVLPMFSSKSFIVSGQVARLFRRSQNVWKKWIRNKTALIHFEGFFVFLVFFFWYMVLENVLI